MMKRPLRRALAVVSMIALSVLTPSPSHGQDRVGVSYLDAIELGPLGGRGSVSLTARVESPGRVTHFLLEGPFRLVVDIQGVEHRLGRFEFPDLRLGPVLGVRTSQYQPGTVRLVLDLSESPIYRVRVGSDGVRVELESSTATTEASATPPAEEPETPTAPDRSTEDRTRRTPPTATGRDLAPAVPVPRESPILAVVTEIAGSTFYVDAGTRHGLFDGDTIEVGRASDPDGNRRLGLLTVVSSASRQALLAFAGRAFPITIGDSLSLDPRRPEPSATGTARRTPVDETGVSARGGDEPATPAAEQVRAITLPLSVHGRIHVSMNAQSSTTRWRGNADPLQRAFVTPTTRLRLEASDLPGGLRFSANLRGSYRHEGTSLIDPAGSLRVYELSVEKKIDGAPVRLQAGRFFSPYEAFTGYFDGALVRVGGDGFGVGGAIGLEPDRWNEGFSTARPKRSAFVDFRKAGPGRGLTGEFAAVQVKPEDGAPEHLYVGWSGQAWVSGLNVAHTVQVDRDPGSNRWVISDLLTQIRLPVGGPLSARGTWSRRSPFYFWRTSAPISYRRDDIGGGLSVDFAGASISGDAFFHQADGDSAWSRSYAGTFRLASLAGSKVGLHGSGSYSDDALLSMLSLATGVDRSWGRSFGRLGYRLVDSSNAWFDLVSHQAEVLIDFPVQPGVRANALGHVRLGRGLRSYRLQIGIWRSF